MSATLVRYNRAMPRNRDEMKRQAISVLLDRTGSWLDARETKVLRDYWGLQEEPRTLKQIGMQIGVTIERVRQIKFSAESRLGQAGHVIGHIRTADDKWKKIRTDVDPGYRRAYLRKVDMNPTQTQAMHELLSSAKDL